MKQTQVTPNLQAGGLLLLPQIWNTLTAIFADCEPGEYAVSGQHMFETRNLDEIHSFALALPNNFMTWMTIVYNWGDSPLDASGGVICADDIGVATSTTNNDLDDDTQKTIQNTVNKIIKQQGSINISYITQIYQQIIQNAINIVNITGNNNTVTQIINQSASQIVNSNATTPEQIDQIINQTAQNQGVVVGNNNQLNQNTTQTGTRIKAAGSRSKYYYYNATSDR